MSCVCAMEEMIATLGSERGIKLWNYIFGGSSLLCIFTALSDPASFDLPLLLPSHASKIFIWTINYSAQTNNSVIESDSEKARDLLSRAYEVPLSRADAASLTRKSLTSCVATLNCLIYYLKDSLGLYCRLIRYITLFFFEMYAKNASRNSFLNYSNDRICHTSNSVNHC